MSNQLDVMYYNICDPNNSIEMTSQFARSYWAIIPELQVWHVFKFSQTKKNVWFHWHMHRLGRLIQILNFQKIFWNHLSLLEANLLFPVHCYYMYAEELMFERRSVIMIVKCVFSSDLNVLKYVFWNWNFDEKYANLDVIIVPQHGIS